MTDSTETRDDGDESMLSIETRTQVLIKRIMALARRDGPNLSVLGASSSDGLEVFVDSKEAAAAVQRIAPEARVRQAGA